MFSLGFFGLFLLEVGSNGLEHFVAYVGEVLQHGVEKFLFSCMLLIGRE